MARNSRYVNLYLTTPDGLIFEGETNDDGKIILPFDRKELLLGPDYEIGLESYTIDTTTMYNVLDDQYEVYFIASDNTQTRKKWPPCKLATVLEVLTKIDEMNLGIGFFSPLFAQYGFEKRKTVATYRCGPCARYRN